MNTSTRNPRTTKRLIVLGLAALAMTFMVTPSQAADNTTAALAYGIPVNSGFVNNVAAAGTDKYFFAMLYANRSYEFLSYPVRHGFDCPVVGTPLFVNVEVSTDSTFVTSISVFSSNTDTEGSANMSDILCSAPNSTRFTVATTGVHFIKAPASYGTGDIYVVLRETTLFSPWLSRAAGYQGFNELHNNTNAPVTVTLRAYNSTGALQGTGITFTIPGNATVFRTGTDIGVPAEVAVGVVLTHNGAMGAISGNITTLSGATGLSFDSPFTPRTDSIRVH